MSPTTINSPGIEETRAILEDAPVILGGRRVLWRDQVARVWEIECLGDTRACFRYTLDDLKQCADQNRKDGTEWCLYYFPGHSLAEQYVVAGCGPERFEPSSSTQVEIDESWGTVELPEQGYVLIDLRPRFQGVSWHQQETKIYRLGREYERAYEAVVSSAVVSSRRLYETRYLDGVWHWGQDFAADGGRIRVGDSPAGLHVTGSSSWFKLAGLGACIVRRPRP
ncbi:MAG: hypothetical protein A3C11_00900 [Candidatus Sungbacteria bacterium RIFCSPHIGHO2_02_FULL_49_12]|uniref:Uncharacterized protein n=1 Tax=Candidatus Sungbacteria bacterium RIFCSPHIGHO2_02_FULL_49_12 TaxID=1802271 RepID=A0A1G2KNL7_9BACT|nr:MAG: hypothetical protein A3C11_00900 [Candidatus Sungbacteria bacterium RIFCSPHIGHO2_02_FULL_49_12]